MMGMAYDSDAMKTNRGSVNTLVGGLLGLGRASDDVVKLHPSIESPCYPPNTPAIRIF